jgi:uroporphyrinogen decarboxylase
MTARENLERTIRHDHPQWVPSRYDGTLKILRSNILKVRPVQGGADDWGVNWLYTNEEEGSYPDNKPVIDIEHVGNKLCVPKTDWCAVSADVKSQLKAIEGKDMFPIAYNELFMFERVKLLLGFEGFMIALVEYRAELDCLIDQIYEYNQQLVEALLDTDIEGIRFTDDWGMQDRLLISPGDWRALFKERYRVLYDMVKKRGKYVFQHSCGRIEEIMDDIVELGVDVLDPCQPAANDIFALKKRYGDSITFMGGLDTQTWLSFGTPQEVYDKTMDTLKIMAKGGGYIAAPSHTITIPEDNRAAMDCAISDYNRMDKTGEDL